MSDCIFCDILRGELPSSMVYRDDTCTALMDIQPVNPGHVLVIPNSHARNLAEMDAAVGRHIFSVGQRMAAALRESGVRCEGVNFLLADGEAAGQEVFHVHLHVFPRFKGDGFGYRFPAGYTDRPERSELDAVTRAIKKRLSVVD
jgi:histidine triad (HIT) family protein